jgi:fumarate reductase subunit D
VKHLLLRLEPVVWVLFGAGILLGTLLLPGYLITVTLAGPLGILPDGALGFDRVHAIAASPPGRLVLLGLVALPIWKGAHHLRSLWIDLAGAAHDAPVAALLYLLAVLGSVLGLVAAVRL